MTLNMYFSREFLESFSFKTFFGHFRRKNLLMQLFCHVIYYFYTNWYWLIAEKHEEEENIK